MIITSMNGGAFIDPEAFAEQAEGKSPADTQAMILEMIMDKVVEPMAIDDAITEVQDILNWKMED